MKSKTTYQTLEVSTSVFQVTHPTPGFGDQRFRYLRAQVRTSGDNTEVIASAINNELLKELSAIADANRITVGDAVKEAIAYYVKAKRTPTSVG